MSVPGSIRAGALHHFRDLLHSAEPGLQGRSYKATLPFRGDMVSTYFQYGVGFLGDTYDSDGEHMLELGVLLPYGLLFSSLPLFRSVGCVPPETASEHLSHAIDIVSYTDHHLIAF